MKITNQDRSNVRRIIAKISEDTDKLVAEKARVAGTQIHPEITKIVAGQNALRVCIEEVLAASTPYDEFFLGEMAVRLASYFISAAPIERQETILNDVIEALPKSYRRMVSNGAVIRTVWETDGITHPNMPEKGDLQ